MEKQGGVPMISYAVCCTTRSGSSFLCSLLKSAGLGEPDEYLNRTKGGLPIWTQCIGMTGPFTDGKHITALIAKYSKNGVFGVKTARTAWHKILATRVATSAVFLRRRDTLRQAISLYRAEKSGSFRDAGAFHRAVPFDETAILAAQDRVIAANGRWSDYLGRLDNMPLSVFYEDVVANPLGAVLKIRDFLGVGLKIGEVSADTDIMSDKITDEWVGCLR